MRQCDQQCGSQAAVYAMDRFAGGWAGYYCLPCQQALGFIVADYLGDDRKQETKTEG